MRTTTISAALLLGLTIPAHAQRVDAELTCAPTETEMEYRCTIELTSGGAPVEGAVFSVKPEMPAMPMAHNLRPVEATTTAEPGVYEVLLPVEMHGRWALRVEITEPSRDLIVLHEEFFPEEAQDGVLHGTEHGHGYRH